MKLGQRKALLIHEANNPDSLYTFEGCKSAYGIEHILCNPIYDWEVYQKPVADVVEYSNDYIYNAIIDWHVSLGWANVNRKNNCIGQYKRTRCGKTGKVKSIELVKD